MGNNVRPNAPPSDATSATKVTRIVIFAAVVGVLALVGYSIFGSTSLTTVLFAAGFGILALGGYSFLWFKLWRNKKGLFPEPPSMQTVTKLEDAHVIDAETPYVNIPMPHAILVPSAPTMNTTDRAVFFPHAPSAPTMNTNDRAVFFPNAQLASTFEPVLPATLVEALSDPAIVTTRLPFETVTRLTLISQGGFGCVYKGTCRTETVAIKTLLPDSERNLSQITAFLREIKLMATLQHAHIVTYVGVAWGALSELCVMSEFMAGGDLRTMLSTFEERDERPRGFDKQKTTVALHIAQALTYMHSLDPVVLHRDLKTKNILLDENQTSAKLSDFGVSRSRGDNTMTAAIGTVLWMAPEVMVGERYDEKADIFSFGIVLSELDTHALPYAAVKASLVSDSGRPLPDTALLQRIMTGRASVSFSSSLQEDVHALALSCIDLNPMERPTAAHVQYELLKIVRRMQ